MTLAPCRPAPCFLHAHPFGPPPPPDPACATSAAALRRGATSFRWLHLKQNARVLWDAAAALGFQDELWAERAADVRSADFSIGSGG